MAGVDTIPEIEIKPIPHDSQRYPTAGDYWDDMGTWRFRVSKMGNKKYELLVILHEFVEWMLTQDRGIKEPDIMAFDMLFEDEIQAGKQDPDAEPGNDPRAPYFKEHQVATEIEKRIAAELGVDWEAYDQAVMSLFEGERDCADTCIS